MVSLGAAEHAAGGGMANERSIGRSESARVGLVRNDLQRRAMLNPMLSADEENASPQQKPEFQWRVLVDGAKAGAEEAPEFVLDGTSLKLLGPQSRLRVVAFKVLFHPLMDTVVLALLGVSFAAQVYQMPAYIDALSDDDTMHIKVLDDTVLVVFTLECVGKILALGFFGDSTSYLWSGWNQLDFLVLACSWADLLAGSGKSFVRLARLARLMRPLRKLRLVEGLVSTVAFYPYILNVCMFLIFFMTIFGTIGMQLFGGTLSYQCAATQHSMAHYPRPWYNPDGTRGEFASVNGTLAMLGNVTELVRCPPAIDCVDQDGYPVEHPDDVVCIKVVNYGPGLVKQGPVKFPYPDERIYETAVYGFDNILNAFLTQFVVTTMDEWPAINHPMAMAGGKHDALVYPFFVCNILLLGMVITNLFVSVICFGFANTDKAQELKSGKEYVHKIRALFDRFDTDAGGTIDASEVQQMAQLVDVQLTDQQVKQAVAEMNAGRGHELTFEQFVEWWKGGTPIAILLRRGIVAEEANITAAFERVDRNGDGTLCLDEVSDLAQVMGITLTPEELAATATSLNVKDEPVTLDTFIEWWLEGDPVADRLRYATRGEDEKLRRMFDRLDTDKSGVLDESDFGPELRSILPPKAQHKVLIDEYHGREILSEMQRVYDESQRAHSSEGSHLDFETFKAWWRSDEKHAVRIRKVQQADEADVRAIWDHILVISGAENFGRIGAEQLETVCLEIDIDKTMDDLKQTISEIDYHGDGETEFAEFYVWMSGTSEFADEIREKMERRGRKPFPYIPDVSERLGSIVESNSFDLTIIGIVVVNTAFMSMEHHRSPDWVTNAVHFSEYFFAFVYLFEALMKIFGVGLAPYLSVRQNCMDFCIVALSFVGFTVHQTSAASSFRVVRLIVKMLRIVRLAEVFARNDAMVRLIQTVTGSGGLLEGLMIFIFGGMCVLSVAAGQILGTCHSPKADGEPTNGQEFGSEGFPRENFYTFWDAMLSNFQIMSGEDWAPMMYSYMSCAGNWAVIYFVAVVIFTNFFLLNIFVAVILENFEMSEEDKLIKQESRYVQQHGSAPVIDFGAWQVESTRKMLARQLGETVASAVTSDISSRRVAKVIDKGISMDDTTTPAGAADGDPESEYVDKSLGGFGMDSPVRTMCMKILESTTFNVMTVVAIVLSAFVIALQGPPDGDGCSGCGDQAVATLYVVMGNVIYFVFLIEMWIKLIANGFEGASSAYWNNGWNRLDFTVVVVGTLDLMLSFMDIDESKLRAIRVLRVLRPLRMLQFNEGIRVVFEALIECLPTAMAVVMLSLLFYIAFAVLGVGMFSGQFYRCDCGGAWGKEVRNCTAANFETLNRQDCLDQGGQWENPPYNFDDIVSAMRTLFVLSTTEGWIEIMHAGMDVTGQLDGDGPFYIAPVQDASYGNALFFVAFILICTFFITNIFIGVLVNFFGQADGTLLMTESQQEWEETKSLARSHNTKQDVTLQTTGFLGGLRQYLFPIAVSDWFHNLMNVLVTINVIVLVSEHVPLSYEKQYWLDLANSSLLICFTVEMLVKLIAYGSDPVYHYVPQYINDYWNRLDFLTVVLSWIGELSTVGGMQALRGIRVLRFAEEFKDLSSLLSTLLKSMAPAGDIFALLCLVYFTFGVVGMSLFGGIPKGQYVTDQDNFDDIFHAMSVMFQISTGQDFMNLMHELELAGRSFVFPFFGIYIITSVWVFHNFFVAVVLRNFDRNFVASQMMFSSWHVMMFKRQWQHMTEGPRHESMRACDLPELVQSLPRPLSTICEDGPHWFNRLLFELNVQHPDHEDVRFHDTLLALCLATHSYSGLKYEEQQTKRADITRHVIEHAARVLTVCVRIWLVSRRGPPPEFAAALRIGSYVESNVDDDKVLHHKWRISLGGVRLLLLDSVVRCNKLNATAHKNPDLHLYDEDSSMSRAEKKLWEEEWEEATYGDNSLAGVAVVSAERAEPTNATTFKNPMAGLDDEESETE